MGVRRHRSCSSASQCHRRLFTLIPMLLFSKNATPSFVCCIKPRSPYHTDSPRTILILTFAPLMKDDPPPLPSSTTCSTAFYRNTPTPDNLSQSFHPSVSSRILLLHAAQLTARHLCSIDPPRDGLPPLLQPWFSTLDGTAGDLVQP